MSIATADRWFSLFIRLRDGLRCFVCRRQFSIQELDCSHVFPCRRNAGRWLPENARAACRNCHRWLESHPAEHRAMVREEIGQKAFEDLDLKVHSIEKYLDVKATAAVFRTKVQAMGFYPKRGPALSTFQPELSG